MMGSRESVVRVGALMSSIIGSAVARGGVSPQEKPDDKMLAVIIGSILGGMCVAVSCLYAAKRCYTALPHQPNVAVGNPIESGAQTEPVIVATVAPEVSDLLDRASVGILIDSRPMPPNCPTPAIPRGEGVRI